MLFDEDTPKIEFSRLSTYGLFAVRGEDRTRQMKTFSTIILSIVST